MDFSGKRILVTGGAGFIGSHLIEFLLSQEVAVVRVLDNLSTGFASNLEPFKTDSRFEFIQGDICDADVCHKACEGIDFVTHQAALGSVPRSIKNPVATNEVNINGFLNMLVAARDAKVKRFVFASSSSVYGDIQASPKVESMIGKPLSPYAVTKQVNELYASVFASAYSMEVIGLRYFNIFGPRQSPEGAYAAVIPLFIDSLMNARSPFINGDGNQTRDFTFVANAVQANMKAFFAPPEATNRYYNIAAGKQIVINDMFNHVRHALKSEVQATHRADRPGDIRFSLADTSLAKKYLGYAPMVSFEEGIQLTVDWFVRHKQTDNAGK